MHNFALTGVGGFIARRHLRAIRDTGNRLVAAVDPNDSVGVLDDYAFDVRFFTELERFERQLEELRHCSAERVRWLSVCSPTYLHDAHCRLGLRMKANVVCEKPLVMNPRDLEALEEIERKTDGRVFTVLQLRVHDKLTVLRDALAGSRAEGGKHDVVLTYVTARGAWYDASWKGQIEKSGGIGADIGVHLFDMLMWMFGALEESRVHLDERRRMAGFLELERARVRWFLSVDPRDLPFPAQPGGRTTFRSITVDGSEVEFSDGFTDLHTRVYAHTLAGRGIGITEARPAIEVVAKIRAAPPSPAGTEAHPFLSRKVSC